MHVKYIVHRKSYVTGNFRIFLFSALSTLFKRRLNEITGASQYCTDARTFFGDTFSKTDCGLLILVFNNAYDA
jgi:hypothetical protein